MWWGYSKNARSLAWRSKASWGRITHFSLQRENTDQKGESGHQGGFLCVCGVAWAHRGFLVPLGPPKSPLTGFLEERPGCVCSSLSICMHCSGSLPHIQLQLQTDQRQQMLILQGDHAPIPPPLTTPSEAQYLKPEIMLANH